MSSRVPRVTEDGAFGDKELDWLNATFERSVPQPTKPLDHYVFTNQNGEVGGRVAQWLYANYGSGLPTTPSSSLDRLLVSRNDGSLYGRFAEWADSHLIGGSGEPSEYAAVETPTHTIQVASKFSGGQTWTSVSDVRTAFQAALDEAHGYAMTNPNALVHVVMPSGVGTINSNTTDAPVNRASTAVPMNSFSSALGFALLPNMQGRITFIGADDTGDPNDRTIIKLTNNARNVFFADTDTGTSWVPIPNKWIYPPRGASFIPATDENGVAIDIVNQGTVANQAALPTGLNSTTDRGKAWVVATTGNHWVWRGSAWRECLPAQKPSARMVFQNYRFERFTVDNDMVNARTHVVFGFVPDLNTPQRYCSAKNLTHNDIRVINFVKNPSESQMSSTVNQAAFLYRTTQHGSYEANGGVAPNTWGDWDLKTNAGMDAATAAGWVFFYNLNFYNIEAYDTTRGILVVQDITKQVSMWMDEINMYRCVHTQDAPYPSTTTQTSFYIGGNCQGGMSRVYDCRSENIGDDGIEFGGLQSLKVRNFYSMNSQLDGILLRYSQPPKDPDTTEVIINGWTHEITPDAWSGSGSITRSRAIEVKVENEAQAMPLNHLSMTNITNIVDGQTGANPGVSSHNIISSIVSRVYRFGWQLDMPVNLLEVDGATATLRNVHTSNQGTNYYKTVPLFFYQGLPGQANKSEAVAIIKNLVANVENITAPTSNATPLRIIGFMGQTSGSLTVEGITLNVTNAATAAVYQADIATIGAVQDEWISQRTNGEYGSTRREYNYVPFRQGSFSNHYSYTSSASDRAWNDSYAYPFALPDVNAFDASTYSYSGGTYVYKNISGTVSGTVTSSRRGLVLQGQTLINSAVLEGASVTGWSASASTTTASDYRPNSTVSTGPMSDDVTTPPNPVGGQDYSNNWYIGDDSAPTLPAVQLYYYSGRNSPTTVTNANSGKLTII